MSEIDNLVAELAELKHKYNHLKTQWLALGADPGRLAALVKKLPKIEGEIELIEGKGLRSDIADKHDRLACLMQPDFARALVALLQARKELGAPPVADQPPTP